MSMSGEQRQIQHTHEHAEIQVHAQPIQEERQQPQPYCRCLPPAAFRFAVHRSHLPPLFPAVDLLGNP